MKLYMATIDGNGNLYDSVSTAEPMQLLKQVFISLHSAEFNLNNPKIADRVKEVDDLWERKFSGIPTPMEVIDYISRVLTSKDRDEEAAEELAEELAIFEISEDGEWLVNFLSSLRGIFKGDEYTLNSMSENGTYILVRIEM